MQIIAKGDNYSVQLRIPTGLVFNWFAAAAISKEMGKYGVKISSRQVRTLMKTMKEYRKIHSDWVLVEVQGADGEYVRVKL